jgi:hypothetical protein
MNSDGQRFLNHRSTARALPGCVAWINRHDHPTSVLSFVRGVRDQLIPGRIRDAFRQTMVSKHVLFSQLFKNNPAETVHPFTAQLVSEIVPAVGNALVDVLHDSATQYPF